MTNEQILKKAIEKAVKGGWQYKHRGFNYMHEYMSTTPYAIEGFIFSHDFAKAFWGEVKTYSNGQIKVESPFMRLTWTSAWKYHLKQMVVWKEPLKYLEGFL